MTTEIDRMIGGLEILRKYKPNAVIVGKSTTTCLLETQELEYVDISADDKDQLFKLGWRLRHNDYFWIMLTERGMQSEQ